ncbi:MAG: hypothetical protein R3D84_15815 [Paracoccaceae bacterium]
MLGPKATPAIKAAFAEKLGLDRPMPVQIARYVGSVLSGDLGTDLRAPPPGDRGLGGARALYGRTDPAALLIAAGLGIPLAARRGRCGVTASLTG